MILFNSYLLSIYAFFVLSWAPFFAVSLSNENSWLHALFYKPFGIADNMLLILYGLSAVFALIYCINNKDVKFWKWLLVVIPLFLIGEETRWGLIYLVDNLNMLPFTGFQDLLQMAIFPWFQARTEEQALVVFIARMVLGLLLLAFVIFLWHERHDLKKWWKQITALWFLPYLIAWALFLLGAVGLEIFTFSEENLLVIIEENLELNAAFAWFIIAVQLPLSKKQRDNDSQP